MTLIGFRRFHWRSIRHATAGARTGRQVYAWLAVATAIASHGFIQHIIDMDDRSPKI